MEELEQKAFTLIVHSGEGRSYAFEAMRAARQRDFAKARELIQSASHEFEEAHTIQTELLTMEANGQKNVLSLLMVHAQDHLMTGLTVKQLADEIIALREDMKAE
jgi:cellobiose PTS system EIIA component